MINLHNVATNFTYRFIYIYVFELFFFLFPSAVPTNFICTCEILSANIYTINKTQTDNYQKKFDVRFSVEFSFFFFLIFISELSPLSAMVDMLNILFLIQIFILLIALQRYLCTYVYVLIWNKYFFFNYILASYYDLPQLFKQLKLCFLQLSFRFIFLHPYRIFLQRSSLFFYNETIQEQRRNGSSQCKLLWLQHQYIDLPFFLAAYQHHYRLFNAEI